MNPFEFVLAIILITTVGSIMRARIQGRHGIRDRSERRGRRSALGGYGLGDDDMDMDSDDSAETRRLRDEVRTLKDRIQTLERIAVDKESTLARQIDELRDR